jgi:lantibiotic biosynthesis protein
MFQAIPGLTARLSTAPSTDPLPALPHLDGTDAELAQWIKDRWADPQFAQAVAISSSDLAAAVASIEAGDSANQVRRTAISLARYLLRHRSRATPFGAWAASLPAAIGPAAPLDLPSTPRLTHHIKPAERAARGRASADAASPIFGSMSVCRNPLATMRPTCLEMAWAPALLQEDEPRSITVQRTGPLSTLWTSSQAPVSVDALTRTLIDAHPKLSPASCHRTIAQLIGHGLLLVNAVQSVTAPPAPVVTATKRTITTATYSATLTVPEIGTELAAEAAEILLHTSPHPGGDPRWRAYHLTFIERHSTGVAIPLLQLLDSAGDLGPPPGYRGSVLPAPVPRTTERDRRLLALAQHALAAGDAVLRLNEHHLVDLQATTPVPPPFAEITLALAATNVAAINRGECEAWVMAASPSLFRTAGRHLAALGPHVTAAAKDGLAHLKAAHPQWRWVQTSPVPLAEDLRDIAAHPRLLKTIVPIGEHPAGPGDLPIDRIGVTADAHRMWAVDLDTGQPIKTLMCNAIEPVRYQHPATRMLSELAYAFDTGLDAWSWGAAKALPVLPRVQYGPIVLAPARWRIDPDQLDSAQPFNDWDRDFDTWCERWRVPRHVSVGDTDVRYTIDLDQIEHRQLLRAEQAKGTVRLREVPDPASVGWAGGRVHEIVFPLSATAPHPAPQRCTVSPAAEGTAGDRRWWTFQLYTDTAGTERLITRHLSELAWLVGTDQLWYLQYQDPDRTAHVRVRVPARKYGDLATVDAWMNSLLQAGEIRDCRRVPYRPETGRYGTGHLLEATEALFAADSTCAQTILTDTAPGSIERDAATAASLLHLVEGFTSEACDAWKWVIAHVPRSAPTEAHATRATRSRVQEAVRMARFLHAAPTAMGTPWPRRHAAAAYLRERTDNDAPLLDRFIADVLHLHCNRVAGPDPATESRLLHLTRHLALGANHQQGTTA